MTLKQVQLNEINIVYIAVWGVHISLHVDRRIRHIFYLYFQEKKIKERLKNFDGELLRNILFIKVLQDFMGTRQSSTSRNVFYIINR